MATDKRAVVAAIIDAAILNRDIRKIENCDLSFFNGHVIHKGYTLVKGKKRITFQLPIGLSGSMWQHIKRLKSFINFRYSDETIFTIKCKVR